MLVREGEPVRAGQVLARLDTADLEAKLIERQGALESARAQLALAEKTRASNVKLLNEKFISQTAFDSSQSGLDVAKGNVKSLEAQVKLAEYALRDAVVIAPLPGIVGKRHAQVGEKVALEAPIVTVVDLAELELQAMVPAIDIPGLAVGMPVELAVDGFGERKFNGRIGRINPSTEPGTRAILVYVGMKNADAALRSGMFANGRIALAASEPIPTLPQAAVRTEAGPELRVDDRQRQARPAASSRSAGATTTTGRVEVKTALPRDLPVLATRFDNLKEGAPALVRARRRRPRRCSRSRARRPAEAGPPRTPRHVDHPHQINNPVFATMVMVGIARARALLVQPAARRADARRQHAVRAAS